MKRIVCQKQTQRPSGVLVQKFKRYKVSSDFLPACLLKGWKIPFAAIFFHSARRTYKQQKKECMEMWSQFPNNLLSFSHVARQYFFFILNQFSNSWRTTSVFVPNIPNLYGTEASGLKPKSQKVNPEEVAFSWTSITQFFGTIQRFMCF